MIEERVIDSSRVVIVPVTTVQEFRTQSIRILDQYMEDKTDMKMLFVLFVLIQNRMRIKLKLDRN